MRQGAQQYWSFPIIAAVGSAWLFCLLFTLGVFDHWPWVQSFLDQPAEMVARRGQLGDSFGMVNALFSGGALLLVAYTSWLQSQELRLQRQELRGQRDQMNAQMIESTFFKMLNAFMSLTDHIDVEVGGEAAEGKEALNLLAKNLGEKVKKQDPTEAYREFYTSYGHEVGHYFRTMYNLFRFIDEFGGDKAKLYARIARAQLTAPELFLLFFNGLNTQNRKFVDLIRKYNILKYIDPNKLPAAVFGELKERYAHQPPA